MLDNKRRARICGAPATTTRKVHGEVLDTCDACATHIDAQGSKPQARQLPADDPRNAPERPRARRRRGGTA